MYVIVTIDGNGYTLPLSQEPGVQKLMSNNLNLSAGVHTLTKAQLFSSSNNILISEDLTSQEFTLAETFTEEIEVNLPLETGGGSTRVMLVVTGVVPAVVYFKTQASQAPPPVTQELITLIGWLGVPQDDLPLYTNPANSQYHVNNPVTSKMKAHINAYLKLNGVVIVGYIYSNYAEPLPLEIPFEKSGNHADEYELVIQTHRARLREDGTKVMSSVSGTTNIPFRGDETVPVDGEGFTKVYMRPDGWEVDPDVEFNWTYTW